MAQACRASGNVFLLPGSRSGVYPLRLSFFMILTSRISLPTGTLQVSPSTRQTDAGNYQACVAIQSGQGTGTHCRLVRFDRLFASREAANLVATTQSWLHSLAPRAQLA